MLHPEMQSDDPTTPYLPLKEELLDVSGKRLRIGYFLSEELFPLSKANERAMLEAVAALKSKGHELIEVKGFPFFEELVLANTAIQTSEGGMKGKERILRGEPLIKEMSLQKTLGSIPRWMRSGLARVLWAKGEIRAAKFTEGTGQRTVGEVYEIYNNMIEHQNKVFSWWNENKFDVMLTPGTALPAVKHGFGNSLVISSSYTMIYNVLNMPAGAVPITLVRKG